MIPVLSRGHFCPKDRRQLRNLVELYPELKVGYTRIVTISTDNIIETNEFRDALGRSGPSSPTRTQDPEGFGYPGIHRSSQRPGDPLHVRARDGTQNLQDLQRLLVLGRPKNDDLRRDLREMFEKIRPDRDISDPELKAAWERGERDRFLRYRDHERAKIAS